jgi:pyrimidine operon attenuation protein/uracil phosphoribosyltransferase
MIAKGRVLPRHRGRFVVKSQVMSAADVQRALNRIAHEIAERNCGLEGVVVIGLQRGGVPLAFRLARILEEIGQASIPVGTLDVAFYRDDRRLRPVHEAQPTDIPFDISGRTVVLVDDVLYTGRTARAALDALASLGRADRVQLAVLVDRGHRELPIRPDYVGKNLPTGPDEVVDVAGDGVFIGELAER